MKTSNTQNADSQTKLSLHHAVDELVKTSLAAMNFNRNTIVNNISLSMYIRENEGAIISVIRRMLEALISNATDSVIYVSAKEVYSKMIELKIKDENCYNTYGVAVNLQDAVPLAEKIGGDLDIINEKQKITTIAFRFPFERE